ncbi:RNA 2',3'-cyclic phosphodiesterase [Halobacillus halophilus]|uniref:RNA 2',3'-cyclic phosphodiesterase n=1 Tax=Halobacillus halophilus TaxID=1570 RepID=UPI001CD57059|nr:RNA 2',3'-cyclic phosphodiesterase [Halobacillus halophilus]MCA1009983.1 RNA 2',3'-cyclic phosphodiesterase [Halobacillus halophilus]
MSAHYFFGIKASPHVKRQFKEWQQILSKSMDYKVWTNPDDLHITIKFLGGSSDEVINAYLKELKKQEWPEAFTLKVGPAGYFGKPIKPRVFYAEVETKTPLLMIKDQVDRTGEQFGFKKENRKFHPHITLAKKNAEGDSPLSKEEYSSVFDEVYSMKVDHIYLFRIHPAQHPKYEPVAKFDL